MCGCRESAVLRVVTCAAPASVIARCIPRERIEARVLLGKVSDGELKLAGQQDKRKICCAEAGEILSK